MQTTRVPEYITENEAQAIIDACSKVRDKLILRTLWETGGRVSEVLSLVPDSIDLPNNCIHMPNLKQNPIRKRRSETEEQFENRKREQEKKRNTRKAYLEKYQGVPDPDKSGPPLKKVFLFPGSTLCTDLLEYAQDVERHKWLFRGKCRDGRVSTTYIWYLLSHVQRSTDRYKRRDGIATKLHVRKDKGANRQVAWPHLFRHGAAMRTYKRTGMLDVTQHQLGHSSIQTTEIYAGMTDEDRKKIIEGGE